MNHENKFQLIPLLKHIQKSVKFLEKLITLAFLIKTIKYTDEEIVQMYNCILGDLFSVMAK